MHQNFVCGHCFTSHHEDGQCVMQDMGDFYIRVLFCFFEVTVSEEEE